MRHPYDLERELLAQILHEIQIYLYLERDPYRDEYFWNPSKDLFPPEAIEHIDEIMGKHGLHPAGGIPGPERFIHRPGGRLEGPKKG
jgi:hypothetical protein